MVLNHFFKKVPYFRSCAFGHSLCALDVMCVALHNKCVHNKWLEQFESHFLRQTTLVHLELWPRNNYRTTTIVDTLTKKVLAESTLLTTEQVGKRLKLVVVAALDCSTTSTVVDQCVNSFLQHSLFISNDDVGSLKVNKVLQSVVSVDNPSVQVVQITGRESTTIELHHRVKFRRKNWKNREDHPFGLISALAEGLYDSESLDRLLAALT